MLVETENVYEKIAHHFSNTRSRPWKWVEIYLASLPHKSLVYDIGCGNGRNMYSEHLNIIGVDTCDAFLSICKESKLEVVKSCMTKLPFISGTADSIISIASFHHLKTHSERMSALSEMNRVMKKNTSLLISVWSKNQPPKTRRIFSNFGDVIVPWNKFGKVYNRYYYIFSINELETMFECSGFEIKTHFHTCGNEVFILIKK